MIIRCGCPFDLDDLVLGIAIRAGERRSHKPILFFGSGTGHSITVLPSAWKHSNWAIAYFKRRGATVGLHRVTAAGCPLGELVLVTKRAASLTPDLPSGVGRAILTTETMRSISKVSKTDNWSGLRLSTHVLLGVAL